MIWTVSTAAGPVTVRQQIEPDDEPAVLELFAACEDWFVAMTSLPSGPGDVQSLYYSMSDGTAFDDKRLFLMLADDRVIGLVDAVIRYPDARSCALGLFLVHPDHRRRGVATAVARLLLDEARSLGFGRVTAPVAAGLDAGWRFARSLGSEISVEPVSPAHNRAVHPSEHPIHRAVLELASGLLD